MEITLYKNGIGYFDKEIYTICSEPLIIKIKSDVVYDNLYAVCNLNKARSVFKVKNGELSIPNTFLSPGVLLINLQVVEKGLAVKKWSAEKLTLQSLDDGYEGIPELAVLRKDINTLKNAVKEMVSLINKNSQI